MYPLPIALLLSWPGGLSDLALTPLQASDSSAQSVVFAGLGFLIGVGLFVRGFRALQRKRLILDTPCSKVRSAALGLVELKGLAVGPHTIPSPITQRPSLCYRTALWQEVGSGKERRWQQAADERFHVLFFLKDNTGMVLVDPDQAEMDIHCDFKGEYHHSMFTGDQVPPRVADFAMRHGVSTDRNIRVEEYCLKPQNPLYILGTLATNPGRQPLPVLQPTRPSHTEARKFDLGDCGWLGLTGYLLRLANVNININLQRPGPTFVPGSGRPDYGLTDFDRKMAERRVAVTQTQPSPPGFHAGNTKPGLYPIMPRPIAQGSAPPPAGSTAWPHPNPPEAGAASALAAVAAKDPGPPARTGFVRGGVEGPGLVAAVATAMGVSLPGAMAGAARQDATVASTNVSVATSVAQPGAGQAAGPQTTKDPPPSGLDPSSAPVPEEVFPEKNPAVICKGANDPTFYISWRSQKEVVSDLSWRASLSIWGGPVLSAACLWYVLAYFGYL